MFFRNLTFFRLLPAQMPDAEALDTALTDHPLNPLGPQEMSRFGFVSPFDSPDAAITHRIGNGTWITLGGELRLLPPKVVQAELKRRIEQHTQQNGTPPGGRARKRLKEEIIIDLIPRAFTQTVRTSAHLDAELGLIVVDTASRKSAESMLGELRQALGSCPALPLNPSVTARDVLSGWISGEPLPDGLTLGEECELKDPTDKGAVVRCLRQDVTSEEIAGHLESGKQVTKLALRLNDRVSFVLGDDLVVRKLAFLDGAVESLDPVERDSMQAELDARYALMIGEVAALFRLLERAFKLTAPAS